MIPIYLMLLLAQPPATAPRLISVPFTSGPTTYTCWEGTVVPYDKDCPLPVAPRDLDALRLRVTDLEKRVKELEARPTIGSCDMIDIRFGNPPTFKTVDDYSEWAEMNAACYEERKASPCDRATTLLIRLIRDNSALLLGERAMTETQRKAVERELEKASGECKEAKP